MSITGRITDNEPNLQNIPVLKTSMSREIRKAFVDGGKTDKFTAWIHDNVPQDPNEILSSCREWVDKMDSAFPGELTAVPGHVFLVPCALNREHWWLVDMDGVIVDPTAHQFHGDYYGGSSIVSYEPWEGPLPTGKCMNCGEYCYGSDSSMCSDKCGQAYTAYLMEGLR